MDYKNQVNLWKYFHDSPPSTYSNKILEIIQAICFKSKFFERAIDQCSGIFNAEISSAEGFSKIVTVIYRRDILSVVSEAYHVFNDLFDT